MLKIFKNEKFLYGLGGAAAIIVAKKIITSKTTRQLVVSGLAKGMKIQNDAKSKFQDMKDEASDICYDAKSEAGLNGEEVTK